MSRKYPEQIYRNISSDSETWGTCCSEAMARRQVEQEYDRKRAWKIELRVKLAAIFMLVLICLYIYATMPSA